MGENNKNEGTKKPENDNQESISDILNNNTDSFETKYKMLVAAITYSVTDEIVALNARLKATGINSRVRIIHTANDGCDYTVMNGKTKRVEYSPSTNPFY